MKHRSHFPWFVFGICTATLLAAMLWLSNTAMDLESAEAAAQIHTRQQEIVRTALWRVDSFLAPLIAAETAWPDNGFAIPAAVTTASLKTERVVINPDQPLKGKQQLTYGQLESKIPVQQAGQAQQNAAQTF